MSEIWEKMSRDERLWIIICLIIPAGLVISGVLAYLIWVIAKILLYQWGGG